METYAPIFNGFYGTAFSFEPDMYCVMDNLCENFTENQKRLIRKFCDENYYLAIKDNYKNYTIDVAEAVCEFLSEKVSEMLKTNVEFEFQNIHSPKYYNYSNDSINVNLKCDFDTFMNNLLFFIKQHIKEFEQYIKDNYTSCDGFMSYYSNDVKDWIKNEYGEHEIGSMLEFALRVFDEDIEEEMIYYVLENVYAEGYCDFTDDFKALLESDSMKNIFNEYEKLMKQKDDYVSLMKEQKKSVPWEKIHEHEEKNDKLFIEDIAKSL